MLLQFLKKVLEMFAFGLHLPVIKRHILYCMSKFCELGESVISDW